MTKNDNHKLYIATAALVGNCPKCEEPTTGTLDSDDERFAMECVNCRHKEEYELENFSLYLREFGHTRNL